MNRYKCPACGRKPLENMGPAETEKAKQEIEEAFEEACTCIRVAIEALKKQVPRKRTGEKGYSECPLCDTCAIGDYCYKCGQRLDWESEG